MTEYAELTVTTLIPAEPGQSRMFRLPVMNPGLFHITATGYMLPHVALAETSATPATNLGGLLANGNPTQMAPYLARDNGIGGTIGLGGVNLPPGWPGGPTGPTGPVIPPPYTVLLDLFHGDELVASGAPPALQHVTAMFDDTWKVRVNFPANAQPTDNVRLTLMPYTSTLPILTRRIPLDFLQQGFDNNWNGRNYISIAFENSTLSIRFDPEIASYYHLSEQDIPVATHLTEVPPNAMVQDIHLSMDSSDGGYEELQGPLPYILVAIKIGGIDGQPMNFSFAFGNFTISDFSINIKFFITTAEGVVENQLQTVVGYRSQVMTDLLDKIAATNAVGDVIQWLGSSKAHSYLYQTAIPQLQNYLDSHAGVVGAALTPWLLGAAYIVWNVRYDPSNSQPIPPSNPDGSFVPQGDIVIDYVGLEDRLTNVVVAGGIGNQLPTSALTITAVATDGEIGKAYALELTAAGGTPPYSWAVSGTLPAGVSSTASSLSGTPTAAGIYPFQVTVTDAASGTATKSYTIATNAPGFSITTPVALPETMVGEGYAVVLATAGGAGKVTWSATGLPDGLTISSTGIISGTPTGDGSVATIIVKAVDTTNAVAWRAFSLTIQPAYLFDNARYTPRGAGDFIWNPPPPPASIGHPFPLPGPATDPGNLAKVDHIVVLMMENRSFDHMLGYLSREGGRSDVEGLKWENDSNRTQFNYYNGRYYYPNRLLQTHLFNPESIGPDHSFESVKAQMSDNMGHFVSDYARNKITDDDPAQLAQVMGYYTGEQLPTYDMLAREFAICDHWFCSHPGPTWPNRFVYLTGDLNRDSYGEPEVNTPLYSDFTPSEAQTIFDLLTARKVSWQYFEQRVSTMRAYTKYTFDMVNVLQYADPVKGFAASVKAGLKSVTFVDPLFGDLPAGLSSPQDNDDAPPSDLADGQRFVGEVVSTLFTPEKNPNWLKTMLVIVYDEHGGFYDHVQPPSDAVPLIGQNSGKLGPRVPAFVVSPWTPAGLVLKDVFDHTSIAATILRRFCSPHPPVMSPRVTAARDLRDALSLKEARGQLSPILGFPTQAQLNIRLRTVARNFTMSSADDSFGSLLGAIALKLGLGGK